MGCAHTLEPPFASGGASPLRGREQRKANLWGEFVEFTVLPRTNMTTAKKQTAFARPLTPSVELAAVIGSAPQPRTEVTKLLWDYIKLNSLQNPANKRNILCDAKLQAVMGKPEVTMFEMSGLVGKHLT